MGAGIIHQSGFIEKKREVSNHYVAVMLAINIDCTGCIVWSVKKIIVITYKETALWIFFCT